MADNIIIGNTKISHADALQYYCSHKYIITHRAIYQLFYSNAQRRARAFKIPATTDGRRPAHIVTAAAYSAEQISTADGRRDNLSAPTFLNRAEIRTARTTPRTPAEAQQPRAR